MYLENMQSYNTFVYKCEEDMTLKKLLLNEMNFSVRAVSHIKNKEYILTVNDKDKPKDSQLKKGDIIKIVMLPEKSDYETQFANIKILYEDDDLLILDKPYNMVSHPTKSHTNDTMLNYAQGIFESKDIKSKVRFISRLDRDTSGIITISKNAYSHFALSQGFLSDKIKKYYTAVVKNNVENLGMTGTINEKIEKSDDGIKRIVSPNGQDAVTHYNILKKGEKYALLELLLETGRTHQIRVHLAHKNLAIIGDELYGGDMTAIQRQALHCHRLIITSPRTMKEIEVVSEYPKDMKDIIDNM